MKKNYKGKCNANSETEGFMYRVMALNLPIPHKIGKTQNKTKWNDQNIWEGEQSYGKSTISLVGPEHCLHTSTFLSKLSIGKNTQL